jgi:hypothetical protein
VLHKYEIGELDSAASLVHYEKQGEADEFYSELKQGVNEYFREKKVLRGHIPIP